MERAENDNRIDPDSGQVDLLRLRRVSAVDYGFPPSRESLGAMRVFAVGEKKLLGLAAGFVVLQGIVEIILVILSRRYLDGLADWRWMFGLVLSIVIAYIFSSYWAIRLEKTLIIKFINDLRARWFKIYLTRKLGRHYLEEKSRLVAKISYHLPLLSTGLSNSLFGLLRLAALLLALLSVCLYLGGTFLIFFAIVFLATAAALLAGFFIAGKFIVQETTFYSQIIRLIDRTLSDWQFIKIFRGEKRVFKEFNHLVELDSFFRIKRDLWLRFSGAFIFVLVVVASLLLHSDFGGVQSFFTATSANFKFSLAVLAIYSSRLLYEGLRTGLYVIPLSLGLSLSVSEIRPAPWKEGKNRPFSRLIFKSTKVRFFEGGPYYHKLAFEFRSGGRYLIHGQKRSGQTQLAKVISGQAERGRRAWHVICDRQKYYYNDFFAECSGFYYIASSFFTAKSILEVALGKDKADITDGDFRRLTDLMNSEPIFSGIFYEGHDWRRRASRLASDSISLFLLQVLYCLQTTRSVIVIDNFWLDQKDPLVMEAISVLERRLPKSVIVLFSSVQKKISGYETYDI